jgi:hypothetical protein
MSAVNAEIALAATRMERRPSATAEKWTFLCECGSEGCAERVQLRLSEYRQLRGRTELLIVAEAHTIAQARDARRQAAALRADAAALRAQSQQIRRRYGPTS